MRARPRSGLRPRQVTLPLLATEVILSLLWSMWEATPDQGLMAADERVDDALSLQKLGEQQAARERILMKEPRRSESAREFGGPLKTRTQPSDSIHVAVRFEDVHGEALDGLLREGMAGRYEKARPLQEHIQKIDAVMLPYLAAGVKAAMKSLGFEGMRPRSPTPPVPPDVVAELERLMRDAGLLNG